MQSDVKQCDAEPQAQSTERDHAGWPSTGVVLTLGALLSLSSIPTDSYLSSLPVISAALRAEPGSIQLTIAGFLVGFSLGQLVWGPIGDRYGRRAPIMLGMLLFVLGSVGCALSQSVSMMIASRVLQAMGACAGHVLARAMVRDLYNRTRSAQIFSILMLIMGLGPLLGPMAGTQIASVAGWRAIFWVLAGIGVAMVLAVSRLPETLPPDRRVREPLRQVLVRYGIIVRDVRLVSYGLSGGFFFIGSYAFVGGLPFVYIDYYGISPQNFALLFGLNMLGLMVAYSANARLVMRYGVDRMLQTGAALAAASAVILAVNTYLGFGGVLGVALPLFVYVSMNGLVVPNSLAGALAEFPESAGSAAAVVGVVHYGCGIFAATTVGILADGTPWTMGWIMALGGVGSLLVAMIAPKCGRA